MHVVVAPSVIVIPGTNSVLFEAPGTQTDALLWSVRANLIKLCGSSLKFYTLCKMVDWDVCILKKKSSVCRISSRWWLKSPELSGNFCTPLHTHTSACESAAALRKRSSWLRSHNAAVFSVTLCSLDGPFLFCFSLKQQKDNNKSVSPLVAEGRFSLGGHCEDEGPSGMENWFPAIIYCRLLSALHHFSLHSNHP